MTSQERDNKLPARVVIAHGEDIVTDRLARELASRLALSCVSGEGACAHAEFILLYREGRLVLHDCAHPRMKSLVVDFRLRPNEQSRRQPLARALGKAAYSVIDATAGLGQDAVRMAAWGHEVLALERSPVIAALLEDGLRRASRDARLAALLDGRLRVQCMDAREMLEQEPPADVVYLDPMFPEKRRRSALARKEMRFLRALVGEDEDAVELVALARRRARRRVVVKRPSHAGPLAGKPDFSQGGKLVRYDVYLSSGGKDADHEDKSS